MIAVGMIAASATVVVRWYRAPGEARVQLAGLAMLAALAPFVAVAVLALPARYGFAVGELETFLEIAVITAVVLRHQLFGIDVTLRRVAVYTTCSSRSRLPTRRSPRSPRPSPHGTPRPPLRQSRWRWSCCPRAMCSTAASAGCSTAGATILSPCFAAVSETSASTRDGQQLLQQVASNLATVMRLPFVAIDVTRAEPPLVAESGHRGDRPTREFPLIHQGRGPGQAHHPAASR